MATRLNRIEEKKSKRQALFFTILTVILILAIIFFGIPSLIKMAIFLSNLRSSGQSIETKDEIAPAPPRLQPLPEATNSAKLTIKGSSEAGAKVKITNNNKVVAEITADKDGQFLSDVSLKNGDNQIYAQAIDTANNESKESTMSLVSFDSEPPKLEVTDPKDGATFVAEDRDILVAGTTDSEARVMVNSFFALPDTEGNFVKKITLTEGENEIKVSSRDKAGNVANFSLKVTYAP